MLIVCLHSSFGSTGISDASGSLGSNFFFDSYGRLYFRIYYDW